MATNRTAINFFWSTVTSLVDTELVTMQRLYTEGMHRLQDNAFYAIGRVSRLAADLLSQADGGQAHIIGDVNIGAFDFNGGAALNGLTIIVDEDTTTVQTCTFDNTITSPSLLLAALVSQAGTNLGWEFTSNGYLKVSSQTLGSGSTISLGAGTANALLFGSASATSPGSGTANDGASRIGVAAIGSIPAGTLRSVLTAIAGAAADCVLKAGDTMTGGLTAPSLTVNNASNTVSLASRSVTRSDGSVVGYDDSDWVATANGEMGTLVNTVATLPIEFYPPHGHTLTDVIVSWQGSGGHAGLPATKPSVEVKRAHLTTGASDSLGGPVSDPSGTTGAYQLIHDIVVSGINEVVDRSVYRYHVIVTSEGGANALSGAVYRGLRRTSAVTRIDEG